MTRDLSKELVLSVVEGLEMTVKLIILESKMLK